MTIDIEIVSRKANFNHVDYNYESSTIIVQHIVLPPPPPPTHTHDTPSVDQNRLSSYNRP